MIYGITIIIGMLISFAYSRRLFNQERDKKRHYLVLVAVFITCILFVSQYKNMPMIQYLRYYVVMLVLLLTSIVDIHRKEISYPILIMGSIGGVVLLLPSNELLLLEIVGGVILGGTVLLLSFITRGAIGLGDGAVISFLGLLLGFSKNIQVLFYGLFVAAIVGIGLILFAKKNKKTEIPFVPFLLIGMLMAGSI